MKSISNLLFPEEIKSLESISYRLNKTCAPGMLTFRRQSNMLVLVALELPKEQVDFLFGSVCKFLDSGKNDPKDPKRTDNETNS